MVDVWSREARCAVGGTLEVGTSIPEMVGCLLFFLSLCGGGWWMCGRGRHAAPLLFLFAGEASE